MLNCKRNIMSAVSMSRGWGKETYIYDGGGGGGGGTVMTITPHNYHPLKKYSNKAHKSLYYSIGFCYRHPKKPFCWYTFLTISHSHKGLNHRKNSTIVFVLIQIKVNWLFIGWSRLSVLQGVVGRGKKSPPPVVRSLCALTAKLMSL